jgi:hypothetical protein
VGVGKAVEAAPIQLGWWAVRRSNRRGGASRIRAETSPVSRQHFLESIRVNPGAPTKVGRLLRWNGAEPGLQLRGDSALLLLVRRAGSRSLVALTQSRPAGGVSAAAMQPHLRCRRGSRNRWSCLQHHRHHCPRRDRFGWAVNNVLVTRPR